MAKTVECKCACGDIFYPRLSDIKRGWGKFCSKSCKARYQRIKIGTRKYSCKRVDNNEWLYYDDFPEGWDEHKDSF